MLRTIEPAPNAIKMTAAITPPISNNLRTLSYWPFVPPV
jgi:hypothetical protein